ncbi:SLC13 family permease [Gammaproteobacteria bacterium]|jgi:di/tricarboxylate transporter|nr:SLC13/DASS family transporter [Candidatus Neomarinimicrobiota bacterium]MDA9577801.1 SLC13 family permease [Gammaproteobacteria bacterium]MDA9635394.1 SLC13 family permease [Gammaproteobacteria bacterium]MDB2482556.1 SLC13 family permease [Gammaproteobacteria bacterium]MDB9899181.1 SLC13 family permease [Gammaproteobacteria bacterium]|tara:strand:+ start:14080 stop:15846 length:1767 start_codon:yes stop_codon:yes gene_type:complete
MSDQYILSITIVSLLGLFIWGKFRYDALASGALVTLIILGVIPSNQAFDGFAHPAVITVALVLIISQGLKNSGLTGLVGKIIGGRSFTKFQFLISLLLIAAILSSFINNIGALAILLPITLNICQKMDWHPSRFLMPLAFACILGGMNTTIGTPPNIIISEYKSTISSAGFNFFDFSYVGLVITLLSIVFIAVIGNKFIQLRENSNSGSALIDLKGYLFEVSVNEDSSAIGMTLSAFKKEAGEDTEVIGIVSESGGVKKVKNNLRIKPDQILVIKTPPDEIGTILDVFGFSIPEELHSFKDEDLEEIEAMITPGSRLIGRKYDFFLKLAYEELNLLGLWRKGARYRTRLTRETFRAGDVLLLGVRDLDEEDVTNKIKHLGLMPLRQRELQTIPSRSRLLKGLVFFTTSIILVALNVLPTSAAFLLCVLGFARIKIIDSNFYRDIDWPIIIMLAAMIPIGTALQTTGLSDVISSNISLYASDMSLFWLLFLILVITMATTDIINNAATAVIMAPISAGIAIELGYAIEPFLMVVAVGASCAFLTPIGHQCNTVIMGPGNYKFTDYWRLGLPLDLLIITVSIPMILFVWT